MALGKDHLLVTRPPAPLNQDNVLEKNTEFSRHKKLKHQEIKMISCINYPLFVFYKNCKYLLRLNQNQEST